MHFWPANNGFDDVVAFKLFFYNIIGINKLYNVMYII